MRNDWYVLSLLAGLVAAAVAFLIFVTMVVIEGVNV
jgi:hypothetical protein